MLRPTWCANTRGHNTRSEVPMPFHYTPKDVERFWSKVDTSGDCWLWQGALMTRQYGSFYIDGQYRRAHRVAYALTYGPIPDGLVICHTCDVPRCVRPEHLWAGTQRENIQDCVTKGRFPFPRGCHRDADRVGRGEKMHGAVATPELVREIRRRYAAGETIVVQLARSLGVGRMVVRGIIDGSTWRHVK